MMIDINQPETLRQHTLVESVLYHLVPGILIGVGYLLIAPLTLKSGYPSVMALVLAAILVLIPLELGLLLWFGKRRNGTWSLKGVVLYRQKLPWTQYLLWVPIIFVASGVIMILSTPVNAYLASVFQCFPESFRLEMGFAGDISFNKLIMTYALHLIFIVFLAPAVEELYFRGFLLPRMPKKLRWAGPLVHSLLFALYHVWSPWMFVARTLALLPLIYVVRWKQNLYLGMGAHWLINSIDFVMGVSFILQM